MRDFTERALIDLLREIVKVKNRAITFEEYVLDKEKKGEVLILRHDVDKKPGRAMRIAEMENEMGIRGTFYFRATMNEFPKKEIAAIARLNHEVGYHYEDLDVARGDMKKAMKSFKDNLEKLRQLAQVKTVCMHGSPLSRYDNRDLWKKFDYHDLGIIGEPYFDVDFSKVIYLTDTGRKWDGSRASIRDRVDGREEEDRRQKVEDSRGEEDGRQKTEVRKDKAKKRPRLHSTQDIINALRNNELPDQIMLTIHPQRWTDEWGPWVWELVSQKVKNVVKYFIVKSRQ